jgi:hypothetical protein
VINGVGLPATSDRPRHHDAVTQPTPDPEQYDSPRNMRARAKGLPSGYITGGEAPDAATAEAEERRLGRWLLLMVITIVAAGFVLGIIAALLTSAVGG